MCLSSGNIRYLGDFSSDFMLKDTETFFRCFIGLECLYTKGQLSLEHEHDQKLGVSSYFQFYG